MVKEERVSQCPVRVVEAALQDYLKVAEMLERDRHTFHPLFDPLEYAHFAQKDFEDIARGGRKIWFAYADEVRESAPIGMVQLIFYTSLTGELHHMGVAEEYRGQNVSSALYKSLVEEAKRRGIQQITLSVDPKNTHAIGIYKHWGFQERQLIRNEEFNFDELIMIASLS